MSKISWLFIASALLAGCGGEDAGALEDTAEAESASREHQSREHQSREHQGTQGGTYSVTSVLINGEVVGDLSLSATTLVGTLAGKPVSGADFVGAQVIQEGPSGDVLEATIDAIAADPGDPSGEILLYTLSVVDETTGLPSSMCKPDASGAARAIPAAGSWTESGAHVADGRVTFGCTSGVIAKCMRWGYKPWKSVPGGASMTNYHQACTRMARADYCGDGQSHTQNGTEIDFYDALPINVNTSGLLMLFDGAWGPDGAYCIGKERWLKLTDALNAVAPACKNKFGLTLLTTSPVSSADVCLVKRGDVPRSSVLIDNRAYLNIGL